MDNLKSLFDKKQYELLLSLSEDAHDLNALLYRINAFIALGNYLGAISVFKNPMHKDTLFKHDPLKCLEMHFALLLHEKRYLEALDELKKYENYPYVSQEVEEYLRSLPKKIATYQENENIKSRLYDEEEIIRTLNKSSDNAKIINYLYYLKKLDIAPYLDSLVKLLVKDNVKDDVKTFALLLLIAKKVNKMVTIKKMQQEYKVNPSQLEPPYVGEKYQEVVHLINLISRDPSIENIALNLFNQYLMNIYPRAPYHISGRKIALAFYILAHKYLKTNFDVLKTIRENHCDDKEISKLANAFQKDIEK